MPSARAIRRLGVPLVLGVLAALGLTAVPATAEGSEASAAAGSRSAQFVVSDEDAEQATAVLAADDRRLTEIRTVSSLARWQGKNWQTPYRLSTGTGYTLVLTPSSTPYTVQDLLQLAPQTFLRMSDGSYLLTEHVVVQSRATLRLTAPGGLTLRLASSSEGFTSIVSLGGKIELVGEEESPLTIVSWDAASGEPDTELADGRAYVRAVGGRFQAEWLHASHLGFWSGRTGGVALTGTDRPNTGAIESVGDATRTGVEVPSLLEDVSVQPAGPLPPGTDAPNLQHTVPATDYVSSRIADSTFDSNAFGLFVSGANGIQVTGSTIRNSLMAGVVLHRFVTNGVISETVAESNVGDGFAIGRATTGITITEATATRNGGSGFRLSGRPLADRPSAVGLSMRSYGNNSVSHSTAVGNGRYGIEVQGGVNIGLQNNTVARNDMGIMVNGPASKVSVTGNDVDDAERHGIALVNGVTDSTVTGNVVDGAGTGVYVRDSSAEITGNTVQAATSHGVSLVGVVDGSDVSFNVLAGSGASALDGVRSNGSYTEATNHTDGWHDTTPWYFWFKKLLQPMTALWSILGILILTSAVRSGRTRGEVIEHPYAHQMAHHGHLTIPQPRTIDLKDADDAEVALR